MRYFLFRIKTRFDWPSTLSARFKLNSSFATTTELFAPKQKCWEDITLFWCISLNVLCSLSIKDVDPLQNLRYCNIIFACDSHDSGQIQK